MSRDELEQEIRNRLHGEGDNTPPEIDEMICQGCGSIISENPHTEEYAEHGSDDTAEVTYCDEECQESHIQELFERE